MSASIKVVVTLPDGNPAAGAKVSLYNESAVFNSVKDWHGITDKNGTCDWESMNTGAFGDIYLFKANWVDQKEDLIFSGEKRERVKRDITVKINLKVAGLEEIFQLNISKQDLDNISTIDDGPEVVKVIRELSVTTKSKLAHASVMLESYAIESFIRTLVKRNNKWSDSMETLTLGQILDNDVVKNLINTDLYRRIKLFKEFRNPATHPKQIGSYFDEAIIGLELIREFIKTLFNKPAA